MSRLLLDESSTGNWHSVPSTPLLGLPERRPLFTPPYFKPLFFLPLLSCSRYLLLLHTSFSCLVSSSLTSRKILGDWDWHIYTIFLIDLYWSIIASQYCVSFCCAPKWISRMYTYIPTSPPSWASLPPSLSHPSRWSQSTELISLCYAAATTLLILCIKQITNENLLYSTGNSTQCSVVT